MAAKIKLPPRRQPIRGWAESLSPNEKGWYRIFSKRTKDAKIPVILAPASAFVLERKQTKAAAALTQTVYMTTIVQDRPYTYNEGHYGIFNSNKFEADHPVPHLRGKLRTGDVEFILGSAKHFKAVRRADVEPLKPINKRGVPTPHASHRMTKWRCEIRSPTGGEGRFYSVRNCTKCGHEQMTHPAGRFSDTELTKACVSVPVGERDWPKH